MRIVEVEGLTKNFGGLRAVDGLSFHIDKMEILGLIGPNGAGKTTVFNLISGVYTPTRGTVRFRDAVISGLKPHKVARMGLARTFQQTSLFQGMTVLENMAVGAHCKSGIGIVGTIVNSRKARTSFGRMTGKNLRILKMLGLEKFGDELPANLSYGHQRTLAMAVALASDPEVLLLDEPVAGMNPEETARVMRLVQNIRDAGVAILLVEHDMKMVMGICDRIVAISFGRKLAEGTPDEIRADTAVINAYLGSQSID